MAVIKDVNTPRAKEVTDVTTEAKKGGIKKTEAELWEEKRDAAAAKRQFEEEVALAEKAKQPPAVVEPAFQVKGSVNLGEFNPQAEAERLRQEAAQAAENKDKKITGLEEQRDHYRDKAADERLTNVEQKFSAQIDRLVNEIKAGQSDTGSLGKQIKELQEVATGVLGLQSPIAGTAPVVSAELQLQMLKMELDDKKAQREFERQLKADERSWQMQLRDMESRQNIELAKLSQSKERTELVATIPQQIGGAIAQGIMHGGGEMPGLGSKPNPRHAQQKHQYAFDVEEGKAATGQCPECGSPIGVGPTTTKAICSQCGTEIIVRRQKASAESPSEEDNRFGQHG